MFDQHDDAASGSEDQQIWRFMDFAQFIDVLERKSLFFARVDTLGDPFAGPGDNAASALRTLPDEVLRLAEQAAAPPPKMGRLERWWSRKAQESEQDNLVKTVRDHQPPALVWASCWHATSPEQMALWKGYHAASKTIAIRSTLAKLRGALAAASPSSVAVDLVRYVDPDSLTTVTEPAQRALMKSNALAYEREVRAILTQSGGGGGCFGRGCGVAVDVAAMIEDVAVSPAAEVWFQELVRRVLRTYELDKPFPAESEGRLALPDYTPERALPSS